jgi:hypothetical protein
MTVGPLKGNNNNIVHSNEEMAGVLNEFFAGVFTREGNEPVPAAETMRCRKKMESCRIRAEKIKEKIRNLRTLQPDQTR